MLTETRLDLDRKQAALDVAYWPQVKQLRSRLAEPGGSLRILLVAGPEPGTTPRSTFEDRRLVVFTAIGPLLAQKDRFDKFVYHKVGDVRDSSLVSTALADAGVTADNSTGKNKTGFLPQTNGDAVAVWIDVHQKWTPEIFYALFVKELYQKPRGTPWTIVVTAFDPLPISDFLELFPATEVIRVDAAPIGVAVSDTSEDLIQILPATETAADGSTKTISILDAVELAEFEQALRAALPKLSAAAPAANVDGELDAARAALADEGSDVPTSLVQHIYRGDDGRAIVRVSIPSVGYLYALRDKLLEESFEKMLNQEIQASASKGKMLEKAGVEFKCDRKSFVSVYQSVLAQLDTLTPHQQSKYEQCLKYDKVHIRGIAGSGKTFLALAVILHHLLESGAAVPVLFISRNQALCAFFVNWLAQRLWKERRFSNSFALVEEEIKSRVRVLFGKCEQVMVPTFGDTHKVTGFAPVAADDSPEGYYVVVDESHHLLKREQNEALRGRVMACVDGNKKVLLVSDKSQSVSGQAELFPPGFHDLFLEESVRNSARIVTAAQSFARSEKRAAARCQHQSQGPPLQQSQFDHIADTDKCLKRYALETANQLLDFQKSMPSMPLSNQVVMIIPSEEFRAAFLPHLEAALRHAAFGGQEFKLMTAFEAAASQAFATPAQQASSGPPPVCNICLTTMSEFDGMERMVVFAIALDTLRSLDSCSELYRSFTRSQMHVAVIQMHVAGGWLE